MDVSPGAGVGIGAGLWPAFSVGAPAEVPMEIKVGAVGLVAESQALPSIHNVTMKKVVRCMKRARARGIPSGPDAAASGIRRVRVARPWKTSLSTTANRRSLR